MATRSAIRYTYEDYLAIPDDTSHRYEVVDGELFVTPSPRARHQEVVTNLARILSTLALTGGLGKVFVGPMTVRLHEEMVLEPDLIFIRADRLDVISPRGRVEGPPDLVVEVLSPSNKRYDRTLKRKHYLENGVPELWIIDADECSVEVWRSGRAEPELARDVLEWRVERERFEVSLAEVFGA